MRTILFIISALIIAFSCISCHYKMSEGGSVVPHTEVIKNQHYYDSVMDAFLNRMDGQEEFSNRDIANICDFSLHNLDASLSETIGYELFHLLKNHPANNPMFLLNHLLVTSHCLRTKNVRQRLLLRSKKMSLWKQINPPISGCIIKKLTYQ